MRGLFEFEQEPLMRMIHFVFAGALAAATVLTGPVLAKNSDSQKAEGNSPSSGCSAYQQAPDGTWEPLPCKEAGDRNPSQTRRSQSHGTERDGR
jgi:hypothetical protein